MWTVSWDAVLCAFKGCKQLMVSATAPEHEIPPKRSRNGETVAGQKQINTDLFLLPYFPGCTPNCPLI